MAKWTQMICTTSFNQLSMALQTMLKATECRMQETLSKCRKDGVEQGAVAVSREDGPLIFTGAVLAGIAAQQFDDAEILRAANRLMREVIAFHLGGKELKSRKVLLEMRRK